MRVPDDRDSVTGAGSGPEYPDTEHGHEWHRTGRLMAHHLHAVATAFAERPVPPFSAG
ncbi:hypothetical protein GCM10007368_12600 [Isoptericola cucumis]|uniref:Uncharacterized protein n=1 Tax=Isoptericola cucumis TaxID=1776856 RepID=A0ABQ2B717_9MICO|nr:hypothetical protein GCM10007368_12600 [Isoptericola cucumis]